MPDNYQTKTARGVTWSFIDNLFSSGITFLVNLVLANLLSPEEFGIVGVTMVFVTISNTIVDGGFSNALIRKLHVSEVDYQTSFVINIGVSLFLYVVLFFASPFIAGFFAEPSLALIIKVVALVVVFNGLSLVHRTLLIRDVDFKTQAKISVVSSVVSAVIGIVMAVSGYGVWALVWQLLVRYFLNAVLLWIMRRWRPRWVFDVASFRDLFGYGSKILVSALMDTLYNNVYYAVVAKIYMPHTLGLYARAEQFTSVFAINFATVLQRVSLPVLSQFQNDRERLRNGYVRIMKNAMLVTSFALLGFCGMAGTVIEVVIGDKWLPCVPYLQILCLAALFQPMNMINQNVLQVKGLSQLFLRLEIIKKIMAVLIIACCCLQGSIYALLWGCVVISFLSFFINSYYAKRYVGYSSWSQLADVVPFVIVAGCMGTAVWLLAFVPLHLYAMLAVQVAVGAILAYVGVRLCFAEQYRDLVRVVMSMRSRK